MSETWLDTTNSQGLLMFHFFSAIAEYERDRLRERTMAGLAAAKARGRVGGPPTKMTTDKANTAHRIGGEKRTIRAIAETIEVSEPLSCVSSHGSGRVCKGKLRTRHRGNVRTTPH